MENQVRCYPPDSSVIDAERLSMMRQLGPDDGWGLLPTLTNAFLEDWPALLAAIRDAVETSDAQALSGAAHQLKGAALNIGAVVVAAVCEQLEDRGAEAPPEDVLLTHLESELARATQSLRDVLATPLDSAMDVLHPVPRNSVQRSG